jgi:hypothetical protein
MLRTMVSPRGSVETIVVSYFFSTLSALGRGKVICDWA